MSNIFEEYKSKNRKYYATWQTWTDEETGKQRTKFEWTDVDYGEHYYIYDIPWTVAYAIMRMGKIEEEA